MKFLYVDESGAHDQGDTFVMCGVMVDAYKLRSRTEAFDRMLREMLAQYPGAQTELKTGRFINGKGAWSRVNPDVRKDFLTRVCHLAVEQGGKVFGIGISFSGYSRTIVQHPDNPVGKNYWLAAAMFTMTVVQKRMQGETRNKGHTVVVMDENKRHMPTLSESIHEADPWFDGLYQVRKKKRGKKIWEQRTPADRFDQIINTPFAIRSHHSSFVQVADAMSYVYRRKLELASDDEAWKGEREYYDGLAGVLDGRRGKIGHCPNDATCVRFYRRAVHKEWKL